MLLEGKELPWYAIVSRGTRDDMDPAGKSHATRQLTRTWRDRK